MNIASVAEYQEGKIPNVSALSIINLPKSTGHELDNFLFINLCLLINESFPLKEAEQLYSIITGKISNSEDFIDFDLLSMYKKSDAEGEIHPKEESSHQGGNGTLH